MKKFFIGYGLVLLLLAIFVLNTFYSTGFFREVHTRIDGQTSSYGIYGAEDLAISREDSFLIISSDDRAARFHGRKRKGALYKLDLTDPIAKPVKLTTNLDFTFLPHGISMLKTDASSYKIWAINHTHEYHSVEVFKLLGDSLFHLETIKDDALISPNDLVAIDENLFYITNDHQYRTGIKRMAEDYLGLALSDVLFYDGDTFTQVADGIAYANGINYHSKMNKLFVASPRGFLVKVFEPDVNSGKLDFIEDIDTDTGVDNIEFDTQGRLGIGSHPNLMHFTSYAMGKVEYSPSEVIIIDYQSKSSYSIESVFEDTGENISASTVAIPFNGKVYIGNVMDVKLLVWEPN